MGAAFFYHLTRSPLERALQMLLERSLANGWRVVVRGNDPARMDWLDQKLWMGAEDQFLPHGLSGGAHDALQPVLLTCAADAPFGHIGSTTRILSPAPTSACIIIMIPVMPDDVTVTRSSAIFVP